MRSTNIRIMALGFLLLVPMATKAATPDEINRWMGMLQDANPYRRKAAAEQLRQAGSSAKPAINALITAATIHEGARHSGDGEAGQLASESAQAALIEIAPTDMRVVRFLLDVRSGEYRVSPNQTVAAMEALDANSKKISAALTFQMAEDDLGLAISAAHVLAESDEAGSDFLTKVNKLARRLNPAESDHWEALAQTIDLIGLHGSKAPELADVLRTRLSYLNGPGLSSDHSDVETLKKAIKMVELGGIRIAENSLADNSETLAAARKFLDRISKEAESNHPIPWLKGSQVAKRLVELPSEERMQRLNILLKLARRSQDEDLTRLMHDTVIGLWDSGDENIRAELTQEPACIRIARKFDRVA